MKKGTIPSIKPGELAQESGIYKSTKTGQRTTLDKHEKAPPTPEAGEKWKVEIPTDPKKR
jgi:hypothetical protein